jgi:predicted RecB family nuclease
METRITRDILESYIFCKYKSYLKLIGKQGDRSDYECLLTENRKEVRLNTIDKIRAQDQIVSTIVLTTAALEQGPLFILDATIQDDLISLSFDGLKRVPGVSKLGQFLYIPMLFYEGSHIRKEQRLLLDLHALFLQQYQGLAPSRGIIWHGRACQATTVRLNPDPRKAKQILIDLKKMCTAESPPKLILNDHCQICEFRERCHDQAIQEDNLSLLRGMSEKEIKGYNRKGILTVTQLAHTFRPRRKGKRANQETKHRYHALQALALRDKRIYVLGTPDLPNNPVRIYLDVESNPDAGFVYLIGLIVIENGSETHYSFWADHKDQEADIFEQFVTEVTRHEGFSVYCYGSYERAFITRMRKNAKSELLVDRILNALVNTLSYIYAHIYFPTYSNGLKEIGRCVGYAWTESDASGIQSIVWRSQWEVSHVEDWKQKLITYNLEDCAALKRVAEILQTIITKTHSEDVSLSEDRKRPPIALVNDVEKLTDFHTWGRVDFVHADYEFVNNCAYFDYQRERVYVRTSKALRKNRAGKPSSPNRKLKASKQIVITAAQCPICSSTEVINNIKKQVRTQEPRVKRAFDIVFTATGMRRRVIEYRTSVHQCLTCSEVFIPDQYQRLDKHFHGLKSWAMFQHIAYRMSIPTIMKMCEDYFGIRIFFAEIHMFKSLMASFYQTTHQRLLEKIFNGALLHVDETEVQLQTGKGYVWVFTNLEEVMYMYRPTREGDFLREMLKEFHGVLVSDFYGAYDGINCPQQKCLIHLMRDINQELLNNPFDEELKLITLPFGILLRKIITTVDEYGLRRKYLKPHEANVDQFFQYLTEQSITSDAAETLRVRLIKYRDKLFTFLNYDGVPWNNNNAEHAIKQFAYYRENTVGMLRESGLRDYLVLLSICQTCNYKGVSFLKFLLSKQQDVDAFCQRKEQRRRPSIELYPEGFVPPHFTSKRNKKSHQDQGDADIPGQDETDIRSKDLL